MWKILTSITVLLIAIACQVTPAEAIVDPLSTPNNRFGIHTISATPEESSPAASLVNSNGGDWGYITVLIESGDRKVDKWQEYFNDLRRRHLIPLVRIATHPIGDVWKAPKVGEEEVWADFLNNLNWPTKNRYVIIYNEPNHGAEWEGKTSPKEYAQVLDKTIDALKRRSGDFFVINAGFDASTPHQPPNYYDEVSFLKEMNQEVPGIFNKLDGWSSHSYPNPGFSASPNGTGRISVRSWVWEQQILSGMGLTKLLPIFITETGWKHNNLSPEVVADNYVTAFQGAWNNLRVVAVTPFVLTYLHPPFDDFSFKKPTGNNEWFPHFEAVKSLNKTAGKPIQVNKALMESGEIYSSLVTDERYEIPFKFKNTGGSIWGDGNKIELRVQNEEWSLPSGVGMDQGVGLPPGVMVEPGKSIEFKLPLKAPKSGKHQFTLQLYRDGVPFDNDSWKYTSEVKSPVMVMIKAGLGWKDDYSGEYLLKVKSSVGETIMSVILPKSGVSEALDTRFLLPDYTFDFTLSRPYYQSKTISSTVHSGTNTLDFESLQPDLLSALLNPGELWKLLPFSGTSPQPCELASQGENC